MPCKRCANEFEQLQTKLATSRGAKRQLLDKQKRISVAMKSAAESLGRLNCELGRLRAENKRLVTDQPVGGAAKRRRPEGPIEIDAMLRNCIEALEQGESVVESKRSIAELSCRAEARSLAKILHEAMARASKTRKVAIYESGIFELIVHDLSADAADRLFSPLCNLLSRDITGQISRAKDLAPAGEQFPHFFRPRPLICRRFRQEMGVAIVLCSRHSLQTTSCAIAGKSLVL